MIKIVFKSKEKFTTDRLKVNLRSGFAVSVQKSNFWCLLKFSFFLRNFKSFAPVERQDKTGHVSLKEILCLLCVVLQELFQN